MSLRETILRQQLVISKLRVRPYSWKELNQALVEETEIQGYNLKIGQRTFQRDIQDIFAIYGIEIINDKHNNRYVIHQDGSDDYRQLEALDVINILKMGGNRLKAVSFEKRRPLGTEHLFGLLSAVNNRLTVSFNYHKFYEDMAQARSIQPYLLKEAKSRWYLIGKDNDKDALRVFGLDRISELKIHKKKFTSPQRHEIEEIFSHSFGIIRPESGQTVEEIILSFPPTQGRYLTTHPLHESQEILINNESKIQLKVRLYITQDLIMELLSHGHLVSVIQPSYLQEEMLRLAFKG